MKQRACGYPKTTEALEKLFEEWCSGIQERNEKGEQISLDDYIFQNAPQWLIDDIIVSRKRTAELRKRGIHAG